MFSRTSTRFLGLLVLVGAMLIAGCAPIQAPTQPAAQAPSAEPAAVPEEATGPVSGGKVTMAFLSTIQDTGDMHKTTSSHSAFIAGEALDTLIRKNPADGSYNPGLATSWEVSPDNLEVTLKLRDDVKFHDGTPFNAEAVKFNLDRIVTLPDAKGKEAYSSLGGTDFYDRTEVVDDYTAKIVWKKPYARALDVLTTYEVGGMQSPTAIEKYGDAYGTDYLVGTGPFKFVSWTGPLGEVTFERNPDYNWASPVDKHQGPAYLDGFTIKAMVEAGTRTSALESGSLEIIRVQEKDYASFLDKPGFKAMMVPKQGTPRTLVFNMESPFLKDARVRQAISHSIDREALVNSPYFRGVAKVANALLTQATWGQPTDEFVAEQYTYDPEKAKALLDEAGWRDEDGDGVREAHGVEGVADGTKLHLVDAANANAKAESEMVQGMLAKVGIEDELQIGDFGQMMALARSGKYDINIWSNSGSHWYLLVPFFHSKEIETGANYTRYSNPEVDKLFDEAQVTLDQAKQRELFTQAQKLILKDAVAVPMWDVMYSWALTDNVEGLDPYSTGASAMGLYFYDTWVAPKE